MELLSLECSEAEEKHDQRPLTVATETLTAATEQQQQQQLRSWKHLHVSQLDDRETEDKFLCSRVLHYRFIGQYTLNGSWYPHVDEMDPLVDYLFPTTAFRRHDRGQNLRFCQGVDQGLNACLWLVYAAQVVR